MLFEFDAADSESHATVQEDADDDEHMEKPISLLQAAADMTRLSRVSQPYTVKSVAWFSLRCTETSSRQFV